jgi:hypothetical protein
MTDFKHIFNNTTIHLPSDYDDKTAKAPTKNGTLSAPGSFAPSFFHSVGNSIWTPPPYPFPTYSKPDDSKEGCDEPGVVSFSLDDTDNNITKSQKDELNGMINEYTDWDALTAKDSDYKSMETALKLMAAMKKTIKDLTQLCDALYRQQDQGKQDGGHPLYR